MNKNSKEANIIKGFFIVESILTIVKNYNISKYNNHLREEAIEKRKLCQKIKIDKKGNKIAVFKKTLENGELYEWEEIISYDPFNLYRIVKG